MTAFRAAVTAVPDADAEWRKLRAKLREAGTKAPPWAALIGRRTNKGAAALVSPRRFGDKSVAAPGRRRITLRCEIYGRHGNFFAFGARFSRWAAWNSFASSVM